jgi:hypothetical protein
VENSDSLGRGPAQTPSGYVKVAANDAARLNDMKQGRDGAD